MKYLIAGGGVAGVTAAREIRKLSPDSVIEIFAAEPYPYYFRPRLWEFISGKITADETYYRPEKWYEEQGIRLHLSLPVTGLDAQEHAITVANGKKVSYDRLLVASGGRSFVPPLPGNDLKGVFALRSLNDAKEIVKFAERAQTVTVIGGGLLGLETAKALLDRGLQVCVVEFMEQLLPRQLDEEGAAVLQAYLENLGMKVLLSAETKEILDDQDGLEIQIKDGRQVNSEMVLFSTGIRSNIEPWRSAGIDANKGLIVNQYLQTSAEDVYCAGDAAEFEGVVYGIIPAATDQAKIAAENMVTPESMVYEGTLPSTRLKIAGMEFNAYGDSTLDREDVTVYRRIDSDRGEYERVAILNGRVQGAIILGNNRKAFAIKKLIESETDVSGYGKDLVKEDFDLNSLVFD